jgi:polysaccharide deacetylase family protein (PEP-CTERM system associated)
VKIRNIISVDVEDYFHPSEVQAAVSPERWDGMPARVAESTRRLLDAFERRQVKGTFFILGWVAERHPALIRQIAAAGHELGCHSYAHQLVYDLTPRQFKEDTLRAQAVIADACGMRPISYRAPSYSITKRSMWALEVLVECGFRYDSSIYPIAHDRYGIPGFSRFAKTMQTASGDILEVPVASVLLSGGRVAPVGGGGYLRLLPYRYTAAGVRRINRDDCQPACLYLHPWEVDPGQPHLAEGFIARLRTYTGLAGMMGKLERLLDEFSFAPLSTVYGNPEAVSKT